MSKTALEQAFIDAWKKKPNSKAKMEKQQILEAWHCLQDRVYKQIDKLEHRSSIDQVDYEEEIHVIKSDMENLFNELLNYQ